MNVHDAANNLVNATVTTSTSQISLTPVAPLKNSTKYTLTITGGASGVKDPAGNALASNYSWSFTTTAVDNTVPNYIYATNVLSSKLKIFTKFNSRYCDYQDTKEAESSKLNKEIVDNIVKASEQLISIWLLI